MGNKKKNKKRLEKAFRDTKKSTYVTGTGQKLVNVHLKKNCSGGHCVIHSPSSHSMIDFPTHWRSDRGLMERICAHGIGHPDPDAMAILPDWEGVHGCDGCCYEPKRGVEGTVVAVDEINDITLFEQLFGIPFTEPLYADQNAAPNGIGPVCKDCHRLIDWHPVDHALGCQWL